MNEEMELDLTVFELEFDAHHRGKQCIREIQGLRENKHPTIDKRLSLANQQKMLEYAEWMIRKLKREEFSVSSFEKNISESWRFCLRKNCKGFSEKTKEIKRSRIERKNREKCLTGKNTLRLQRQIQKRSNL